MKRYVIMILTLFPMNLTPSLAMMDLGVYGMVFPIKERNILEVLQEKLASPMGQNLLREFETNLKKVGEGKHYVPTPVASLTLTPQHRSYLFDPSVSLAQDLVDHNQINPLEHMTLSKEYLFIDGDRPTQISWAKRLQSHKKVMIILVKGDPMRLMVEQDIKVFFDQEGAMTKRFQLTHVPCSLAQDGKSLRITEWTEDELLAEVSK